MDTTLFEARKDKLFFYSPYNYIRSIPEDIHLDYLQSKIKKHDNSANDHVYKVYISDKLYEFYYSYLTWDSEFFSLKTIKLNYVLYEFNDTRTLSKAIDAFLESIKDVPCYFFIDIPTEDTFLIQALGLSKFKLLETRINFYNDHLQDFNEERYNVREATLKDLPNLEKTAKEMRNIYDRLHAETVPVIGKADDFIAKYVENSIKGFADIVIVPNEPGVPADSFLTARYQKEDWILFNKKISKMVISAVSAATNRGWYKKLISEMTYHLRDKVGTEIIILNTQSTNRAVIKTWESLKYNYGYTNLIFSYYKPL